MPLRDGWMFQVDKFHVGTISTMLINAVVKRLSQLSLCKKTKSKRDHGGIFLVYQSKWQLFVLTR